MVENVSPNHHGPESTLKLRLLLLQPQLTTFPEAFACSQALWGPAGTGSQGVSI